MKKNPQGPPRSKKSIILIFCVFLSASCGLNVLSAQKPVLIADVMPLFQGNESSEFSRWIRKNCIYPDDALAENIGGRVSFSFVVDKKGKVTDVFIIDSPHRSLSWEVRNIINNSPTWTPGQNGKKKVPVLFYMYMDFELREKRPDDTESVYIPAGFQDGFLPEFRNWVAKKIRYPEDARDEGVTGSVEVRFVIERDGSLTNIIITESPHPSMSEEVKRVLKRSPNWTPATLDGQPVRLRFRMPVEFRLGK